MCGLFVSASFPSEPFFSSIPDGGLALTFSLSFYDISVNIQKTKIMASGAITSWQIDGETVETVRDYFLGLQNHCRW